MLIYVECFLIYCLGQGLPGETAKSEPRLWQLKPQSTYHSLSQNRKHKSRDGGREECRSIIRIIIA